LDGYCYYATYAKANVFNTIASCFAENFASVNDRLEEAHTPINTPHFKVVSKKWLNNSKNMNRFKIFIFSFLFISFSVKGQQLRLGVSVDPQVSWMKTDVKTVGANGGRLGVNFGLVVEKYFAANYAFATGISISSSGGKLLYKTSGKFNFKDTTLSYPANTGITYKLQYLTIPFSVKLKTNRIGYLSYYAVLGLTAQINIKANADVRDISDDDIGEDINLFNLGYHFGGGVEYALGGNTSLFAGIIYTNGFSDITSSSNDKVTLNNFALKLGIMF